MSHDKVLLLHNVFTGATICEESGGAATRFVYTLRQILFSRGLYDCGLWRGLYRGLSGAFSRGLSRVQYYRLYGGGSDWA